MVCFGSINKYGSWGQGEVLLLWVVEWGIWLFWVSTRLNGEKFLWSVFVISVVVTSG